MAFLFQKIGSNNHTFVNKHEIHILPFNMGFKTVEHKYPTSAKKMAMFLWK